MKALAANGSPCRAKLARMTLRPDQRQAIAEAAEE
jgi:hypothetical protein